MGSHSLAPLTQTSSLTRTVFPIRPFPDNDVKKPGMFVFKDWEDYQKNGKNVDAKYNAGKKGKARGTASRYVRHKKFGEGVVMETKGEFMS